MRKFVASSESEKFPAFIELCQRFCDEHAAESVHDQFKRTIDRELARLEIRCFERQAADLNG
jgi:hypothetical protein